MEYKPQIPGGKGENLKPEDVNQNELKVGIEVEYEHTNNETIATEIALDHLAENPKYYTDLVSSGIVDEPKAIKLAKELLDVEPNKKEDESEDMKEARKRIYGLSPEETLNKMKRLIKKIIK